MSDPVLVAPAPQVNPTGVAEGAERKGVEPTDDPDCRHATPAFRVEPTTETDPRKGR